VDSVVELVFHELKKTLCLGFPFTTNAFSDGCLWFSGRGIGRFHIAFTCHSWGEPLGELTQRLRKPLVEPLESSQSQSLLLTQSHRAVNFPGMGSTTHFVWGGVYWVSSYSNVDSFASVASIPTAKPWESEENHLQLGMGQNCLYRILRINSHLWARHLLFRPSLIDTGTWRILPLSNWLICLVIVSLQFVGLSWNRYSMLFSEILATY